MYTDPNLGSIIFQVIIASIGAVGAYFVLMKNSFKKLFSRKKKE